MFIQFPKRLPLRSSWTILPYAVILILFVAGGIFADKIVPHSPTQIELAKSLVPPFWQEGGTTEYLLGTDKLGRDILSRIIYGARVSMLVAVPSVFVAGSVGAFLGILAGYKRGWVDSIISRAIELMLGFPTILLALVLAIVFGPSLYNIIVIVILMYWARYARQARGETLQIREKGYVILARSSGCSDLIIMLRHILPNVANSLIVLATFNIGNVIILEAALSFLGAGVPPPAPSWGSMTAAGRDLIFTAWWVSFMPGLAITLVVLSGNVFGDWLRDRLDPKLQNL